jgi:NitT/TauT family transport system substrate-binding protein
MVSPDINDAADLVGKSVAVTRPGTATYTSLIIGLQHLGLEPDKDVAIIAVGSHADIMGALTSGAVDGAIQGVPLSIKSKDAGFRELLNISNLRYPYQHLAIATSRKFLDERPEDGLNLMRAITDAVHEMQNDPEGSKKVLAQYLALDPAADADLLEATYQVVVKEQMEAVPNVSKEGVQAVIDIAAKDNPTASALDVEDVIDTSIMDTLKSTGFLESLER